MIFEQWKKQHFNISCAAYAQWEVDNDPSFAEQQLNKHLKEFGIGKCFCGFSSDDLMLFPFSECPNCKFRYQLAKGGCMHFRCLQCGYDFCGGCSRPFKLGNVSAMQSNARIQFLIKSQHFFSFISDASEHECAPHWACTPTTPETVSSTCETRRLPT